MIAGGFSAGLGMSLQLTADGASPVYIFAAMPLL
jgi:hypothetical protein